MLLHFRNPLFLFMIGLIFFSIDLFKSLKNSSGTLSFRLTLDKPFLNLAGANPVRAMSALLRQAIAELIAVRLNLAEFSLVLG